METIVSLPQWFHSMCIIVGGAGVIVSGLWFLSLLKRRWWRVFLPTTAKKKNQELPGLGMILLIVLFGNVGGGILHVAFLAAVIAGLVEFKPSPLLVVEIPAALLLGLGIYFGFLKDPPARKDGGHH